MAEIEVDATSKKSADEEKVALQGNAPKSSQSSTKQIDIHWNYQSSFTSIKIMILGMLITELITSLGMAVFAYTHPGDPMLDITMGSFLVITGIFLIAIYPEDNSWIWVIRGNKISLTFLIALRGVTTFLAILIAVKAQLSVMPSIWFTFQVLYLALSVVLVCYPRTPVGNLVLKS